VPPDTGTVVWAPRVPISELPVPSVPSEKVVCVVCEALCWSSLSSRLPEVDLHYICTDCIDPLTLERKQR
jgi:hypothetical protein